MLRESMRCSPGLASFSAQDLVSSDEAYRFATSLRFEFVTNWVCVREDVK